MLKAFETVSCDLRILSCFSEQGGGLLLFLFPHNLRVPSEEWILKNFGFDPRKRGGLDDARNGYCSENDEFGEITEMTDESAP